MIFDFTQMTDREVLVQVAMEQKALRSDLTAACADIKDMQTKIDNLVSFREQIAGERRVIMALGGIISIIISVITTMVVGIANGFGGKR